MPALAIHHDKISVHLLPVRDDTYIGLLVSRLDVRWFQLFVILEIWRGLVHYLYLFDSIAILIIFCKITLSNTKNLKKSPTHKHLTTCHTSFRQLSRKCPHHKRTASLYLSREMQNIVDLSLRDSLRLNTRQSAVLVARMVKTNNKKNRYIKNQEWNLSNEQIETSKLKRKKLNEGLIVSIKLASPLGLLIFNLTHFVLLLYVLWHIHFQATNYACICSQILVYKDVMYKDGDRIQKILFVHIGFEVIHIIIVSCSGDGGVQRSLSSAWGLGSLEHWPN